MSHLKSHKSRAAYQHISVTLIILHVYYGNDSAKKLVLLYDHQNLWIVSVFSIVFTPLIDEHILHYVLSCIYPSHI